MATDGTTEEWRPGSFTKNFSWGSQQGLRELHEIIRVGFAGKLEDTPRALFRSRVANTGRPDYIPLNFFLFNRISNDEDFLIVDELIFQAISFEHSRRFDILALYAFLLSMVGTWKTARSYQGRPALWAQHYVVDRLGGPLGWNALLITADDIENFVHRDPRYHAKGARKLATNLNYLLKLGGIAEFGTPDVSRWWVDAIFLTLDRVVETRYIRRQSVSVEKFTEYLIASGFPMLSGRRSIEKDLATRHVVSLFRACGARSRFNEDAVRELTNTLLADVQTWIANNPEPIGAVHVTNPRIIKTIPRPCAMLAQSVGFQTFDLDELAELNFADLVRQNLEASLKALRERGISPSMTAEELMKLMRDK